MTFWQLALVPITCLFVLGCAGPQYSPTQVQGWSFTGPHNQTETVLDAPDWANRFRSGPGELSPSPPTVREQTVTLTSESGTQVTYPVARIVFGERAFFDFDIDIPKPDARATLDLIAESMRRSSAELQLTVLGHTDAIGTDAYNMQLSRRRAATVVRELVARGVRPGQLSIVAIGMRQPVAPNGTPEGRALNRRVEFVVSRSLAANIATVEQTEVAPSNAQPRAEDGADHMAASEAEVLRPNATGDELTLAEIARLRLASPYAPMPLPPETDEDRTHGTAASGPYRRAPLRGKTGVERAATPSAVQPVIPQPHYEPRTPEPGAQPNPLGPPMTY
jgi:outer membrane protein OmpA-like peptidoglycan-associated protein